MGLVRMQKVLLLGHESDKEQLLDTLQEEGILHLSSLREDELAEQIPDLAPGEGIQQKELESLVDDLNVSASYLASYAKPPSLLEGILPSKLEFIRKESDDIIDSYDASRVISRCKQLQREKENLNTTENALNGKIELLSNWAELDIDLKEVKNTKMAAVVAVSFEAKLSPEELEAEFAASPVDLQPIGKDMGKINCIVAYMKDDEVEAKGFLKDFEPETVDFSGLEGTPKQIIDEAQRELLSVYRKKQEVAEESKALETERRKLLLLYDHYASILESRQAEAFSLKTRSAFALMGWIRLSDRKRLDSVAERFESVSVTEIEPSKGEEPPVELTNARPMRAFETITELYAMPKHFELDPTPLLSIWFALFFALCLTDAGYGLILAVVALVMMPRIQGNKRTLWLLFTAGVTTIFVGAMTGAWFGDLADYTNIPVFVKFRHALELFDPMKSPIVFFRLALGAGVAHVFFGLGIRIYQDVRHRAYLDAFADQFLWMVWWGGVILMLFSTDQAAKLALSNRKLLPEWMARPGMISTAVASLLILVLAGRKEESFIMKGLMGAMRLTVLGGVFSFLGDFLSYLRLMALGMTTGGIAMAINAICLKALPIPKFLGALIWIPMTLMLGVFINVLGGYVHTLRLQYVEFFQKFYTGGGEPFRPFAKQHKYTLITQAKPQKGGD